MTKFLLIAGLVVLAYWLVKTVRRRSQASADKGVKAKSASAEDMVRCAQCGVHLPRSESLISRGAVYCCAEHQREHQG